MKIVLTKYQQFLRQHGRKFPYSQVRKTRRTFYSKWIILRERHGGRCNVTLPSSTIDKATLNHLIISLQAWPLSPGMDEIIDYMERYGRLEDNAWYHNVVNWIAHICSNGIRRCHMGLLYDCVALRVREIVYEHTGSRVTQLTRVLLEQWRQTFFAMYEHGTTDFVTLHEESVAYILNRIRTSIPGTPSTTRSMEEETFM